MARTKVTIELGFVPSAAALASRHLTIIEMRRAGVDAAPTPAYDNNAIGGTTDSVDVDLKNDKIWQAKLVDTKTSGEVSTPQVVTFSTGALLFPGPRASDGGTLRVYAMEDLSSSSESSVNSSSSSSTSSSISSSSLSSLSSSSSSSSNSSSVSSASSVNSSSSSLSSDNSSSSSSSSINSSSSSSSVSSSSSSSGSSSSSSSNSSSSSSASSSS